MNQVRTQNAMEDHGLGVTGGMEMAQRTGEFAGSVPNRDIRHRIMVAVAGAIVGATAMGAVALAMAEPTGGTLEPAGNTSTGAIDASRLGGLVEEEVNPASAFEATGFESTGLTGASAPGWTEYLDVPRGPVYSSPAGVTAAVDRPLGVVVEEVTIGSDAAFTGTAPEATPDWRLGEDAALAAPRPYTP